MASANVKRAVALSVVLLVALAAAILFLERHTIADRMMIAAGKRAIANHVAIPVDLTAHYAVPASTFENGNGSSYWYDVPWGFQVFDHVPLQIDGMMFLWGEGNAQKGASYPDAITGIAVNQKFDTLYVYHCAFFSSPDRAPVYELVFRYADGSSLTNQMLYGTDVLDFNSRGKPTGPTGANSKLAWVGASFSPGRNQPLRFILTAIKNPLPATEVASIDLYSCKGRSAGCVLAMTAGPAGMMK